MADEPTVETTIDGFRCLVPPGFLRQRRLMERLRLEGIVRELRAELVQYEAELEGLQDGRG